MTTKKGLQNRIQAQNKDASIHTKFTITAFNNLSQEIKQQPRHIISSRAHQLNGHEQRKWYERNVLSLFVLAATN